MKVDLDMVEVETTVFISGRNFGPKIFKDPKLGKSVDGMWYDTDLKLTFLQSGSKVVIVQNPKGSLMRDPSQLGINVSASQMITQYQVASEIFSGQVQVSTPLQTVRRPGGKKPKFQGEESQGE